MKSQWECLLQNLGEWQGSFTRLSPQGELLSDTPTVVVLTGLNNNQTMRQIIRRLTTPVDEKVLEYNTLGRGVLFLETGAFSQGSIQFGPFSEFGTELGLIEVGQNNQPGDRRLRIVQLFNKQSQLDCITLIRERRATTNAIERSPLLVQDLIGTWQGTATTVYTDWRDPVTSSTRVEIRQESNACLSQTLTFGDEQGKQQTIRSVAEINGQTLHFNQGNQPVQVLLLPDGASSTCPEQIKPGYPFFLEIGWLLHPDRRQRLIRSYSDRGEWISLTLIIEQKINESQP